jgi:hypothetical protein
MLFIAAGLVAGVAVDAWLQLAEIQSPLETYVHPDYGPAYYPDRQFSRFNEGFFLGGTNEWGYLGEGRPRRNEGDELRVLLVGDSFVLGHTVFERHHFKNRIGRELSARLNRPVVVLNFARADFHLWNMHRFYRDFVCQWDHDLALLFTNQQDLRPHRQFGGELYPVTTFDGQRLASDTSFRESGMYRQSRLLAPLISRSAITRLALNAYKLDSRGRLGEVIFDKLWPLLAPTPAAAASGPPARKTLPAVSGAILRELAADPRVRVVFSGAIDPDTRAGVDSPGLRPYDIEPVLDELRDRGIEPTYWPVTRQRGHWNHTTHDAIGASLARQILDDGVLE